MSFGQPKRRKVPTPELIGPHRSQNPGQPTIPNPAIRIFRQQVLTWSAGAITLIISALAVYGPWFDVTDIKVTGTRQLDPGSVERTVEQYAKKLRWGFLPNRNLWLLSTRHLHNFLTVAIGEKLSVDEIHIQKSYRHQLRIRIAERLPLAVWQAGNVFGTIDRQGIIVELVPGRNNELPLVVDENQALFRVGQRVVEPAVMTSLMDLQSQLRAVLIEVEHYVLPRLVCPEPVLVDPLKNTNINAAVPNDLSETGLGNSNLNTNTSVLVPNPCDLESLKRARPEIHAQVSSGPRLLFDRFQDFGPAVITVQRLLGTNPAPQEYIDVRFGDRAYVK